MPPGEPLGRILVNPVLRLVATPKKSFWRDGVACASAAASARPAVLRAEAGHDLSSTVRPLRNYAFTEADLVLFDRK